MFTVDNNNKNLFISGIEIHSNVSKISTSHIIEQRLTVLPSIRHRCNAKHNKNCKMYIHEIKHIRLVDVFQFLVSTLGLNGSAAPESTMHPLTFSIRSSLPFKITRMEP